MYVADLQWCAPSFCVSVVRLVWQMCLKLVHHYAFDIDLITLPDVVVLIYLEPILAKEWKTFRAVWKHLFLKIPTFFFKNKMMFQLDSFLCWYECLFNLLQQSYCVYLHFVNYCYFSKVKRVTIIQSLSNRKLNGQEWNRCDFCKGLQHESDSPWLGRTEHLWTCVMWTVICFHKYLAVSF